MKPDRNPILSYAEEERIRGALAAAAESDGLSTEGEAKSEGEATTEGKAEGEHGEEAELHGYPNATGTGSRIGDFFEGENFGATVLMEYHCAHYASLTRSRGDPRPRAALPHSSTAVREACAPRPPRS